ncbi:VOC family protein [Streptococcus suis]|nr:VOC family protein [Streptococcus suis]
MNKIDIKSLVSVFHVSDFNRSIEWYKKWLGDPTNIPMEGIAEYEITPRSWLQLSCDEANQDGAANIVLCVNDIYQTKESLELNGIATSEILDYDIVLVFDISDEDGNKITFSQEL